MLRNEARKERRVGRKNDVRNEKERKEINGSVMRHEEGYVGRQQKRQDKERNASEKEYYIREIGISQFYDLF